MHAAKLMPPALAAWLAGVALQLQQPALWGATIYGSFLTLALILIAPSAIKSIAFWLRVVSITTAFALLGFASTGLRATAFSHHALDPALEGKDISVTGLVAAMPQYSEAGTRFRFDVEQATLDGQPVRLPPRLQLGWYGGVWGGGELLADLQRTPQPLQAGERWRMAVRLKAPHGGSNPHGFDFELWLWEQGLQATGYVRAGPRDVAPQRLAQTAWHPVEWARQQVRDAILQRLQGEDHARVAGVVAALVTGDQQAIDRADWDVFRATGVAHLMSISGLHVTLFAWLAGLAIGWLWRRSPRLCLAVPAPHAGLIGGLVLALAYALFSGWGVPAQRTVWMLATVSLLRLSARRWPWPQVWLLTCAVVVATDPWALLQPGFWLSFVAVGVLFATDNPTLHLGRTGLRRRLLALLREQGVLTLALTPLTLLLFGQVSLVGLLANVLAIPWVTLVVTPLALLGVLLPPLWELAAHAVQLLTFGLGLLAQLPLATLAVAQAPLWAGVAGLLGGTVLVLRLPWRLRALGLPLLLPVLLWQAPRPSAGQFALLAADIGQGNAVLVQTATHALLYDAGPRYSRESDAGHRVLVPLLRALDVRLDRVVLSHRDADHTGGAPAVLAMQPRAGLLSSIEDTHELQALRCAVPSAARPARPGTGTACASRCCTRPRRTTQRRRAATRCPACCASATGRRRCCWRATSKPGRRPSCCCGARRCRPTCCWCRTTAARPPAARPSSMRWRRNWHWCRPATATASATRRRRCWRAMPNAASAWSTACTAARCTGSRPGRARWPASASRRHTTGSTMRPESAGTGAFFRIIVRLEA